MNVRKVQIEDSFLLSIHNVSDHVFCPRFAWLKHVEGLFEQNEESVHSAFVHRNVGKRPGTFADADGQEWDAQSLWLSDEVLGVSGRLDRVVSVDDHHAFPVEFKEGRSHQGEIRDSERVQLSLQAMLLEAKGLHVDKISVWYDAERRRVEQPFGDTLRQEAREAIERTRQTFQAQGAPEPLGDDARCFRCPLNDSCLPDEVRRLSIRHSLEEAEEPTADPEGILAERTPASEVRRILPPAFDTLPLYVDSAAVNVRLRGDEVRVEDKDGGLLRAMGIGTISHVNVFGNANITTPLLRALLDRGIPVCFFSSTGWYRGRTSPSLNRLVHVREDQYEAARDTRALEVSKALVQDKVYNSRILLRRNLPKDGDDSALSALRWAARSVAGCDAPASLLGIEGNAARIYWRSFGALTAQAGPEFAMSGRSRRPPLDRVNAVLSYLYGMLTKDMSLALEMAGFDPFQGFYHTNHHGRPSLALDMMEPFRPLIADSVALTVIRKREVQPDDFHLCGQEVSMKPAARKAVIRAYERRMEEVVTHPVFGYSINYRRVLYVQARLLSRYLAGELAAPPSFRTR